MSFQLNSIVPPLSKNFPPGGAILAIPELSTRAVAIAEACTVAAVNGFPEAFDGLEPSSLAHQSSPGLFPDLGSPANSHTVQSRLLNLFPAKTPPSTPWRPAVAVAVADSSPPRTQPRPPRPRPRRVLSKNPDKGGTTTDAAHVSQAPLSPDPLPADYSSLIAKAEWTAIVNAAKANFAQIHALFPSLSALVANELGRARNEVPPGVLVSCSSWQMQQHFGFLAIQASVVQHAPSLGLIGKRLLRVFESPKSFDVFAARHARQLLGTSGRPGTVAQAIGCIPLGTFALYTLLEEGPNFDGGNATSVLDVCRSLTLTDQRGQLDFTGVHDVSMALADARRRNVSLPTVEIFTELVNAATAAAAVPFTGLSQSNEMLHWQPFALDLAEGARYESAHDIRPQLEHVDWLVEKLSDFGWAVASSTYSRHVARARRPPPLAETTSVASSSPVVLGTEVPMAETPTFHVSSRPEQILGHPGGFKFTAISCRPEQTFDYTRGLESAARSSRSAAVGGPDQGGVRPPHCEVAKLRTARTAIASLGIEAGTLRAGADFPAIPTTDLIFPPGIPIPRPLLEARETASVNVVSPPSTYSSLALRKPEPHPPRRGKEGGHSRHECEPPGPTFVDKKPPVTLLDAKPLVPPSVLDSTRSPAPFSASGPIRLQSAREVPGLVESELHARWDMKPNVLPNEPRPRQRVAKEILHQPKGASSIAAAHPRRQQRRGRRWKVVPIFFGSLPEPVYCRYPVHREKSPRCAHGNDLPIRTSPTYDRAEVTGGYLGYFRAPDLGLQDRGKWGQLARVSGTTGNLP